MYIYTSCGEKRGLYLSLPGLNIHECIHSFLNMSTYLEICLYKSKPIYVFIHLYVYIYIYVYTCAFLFGPGLSDTSDRLVGLWHGLSGCRFASRFR